MAAVEMAAAEMAGVMVEVTVEAVTEVAKEAVKEEGMAVGTEGAAKVEEEMEVEALEEGKQVAMTEEVVTKGA